MRRMRVRDRIVVTVFALALVSLIVGFAFLVGYLLGRVLL